MPPPFWEIEDVAGDDGCAHPRAVGVSGGGADVAVDVGAGVGSADWRKMRRREAVEDLQPIEDEYQRVALVEVALTVRLGLTVAEGGAAPL